MIAKTEGVRSIASITGTGASTLLFLLTLCVFSPPDLEAQLSSAARIEVESQESVSVVGSSDSLRAVIEELCESSGVELRSYRAPDRAISARYEGVPLQHVLQRLLREESFMLGFSGSVEDGASGPQVAWVTVIGTNGGGAVAGVGGNASASAAAVNNARASSILPISAMANPNAASRVASAKAFARRLDAEDDLRGKLVRASIGDLTTAVAGQKHARAYIQTVRTQVKNAQVRAKLNALLARVR